MRAFLKILLLLLIAGPAYSMTEVCSTSTPADTGAQVGPTVSVVAANCTGLAAGDLVLLVADVNRNTTLVMSATGGQTWYSGTIINSVGSTRVFWAIYNGTWGTNPSVLAGNIDTQSLLMRGVRPTAGYAFSTTLDIAETTATYSAPGSPFDVTITGVTTSSARTMVFVVFETIDDITWTQQTGGWTTFTPNQTRNNSVAGNDDSSISTVYQFRTSAGATGSIVSRQDNGTSGNKHVLVFKEIPAVVPPTFSVAPAIGTRTTNSIQVTATTACTDCTFYGAAVADGSSALTCDQMEAQTGGAYKYFSVAMTATVQGTGTFTSYTDGTVRDFYGCLESVANGDSSVASIADIVKIPAFSVTPSVGGQNDNSYTVTKTLDGPGTVYAVDCIKDQTAPTYAQVAAGQCTGSVSAIAAASDDATGTLTLGGSLTRIVGDLYVVGTYGGQQSSVYSMLDECLDPPSGYQNIGCPGGLTSIESTSILAELNLDITPDIATGDIPTISLTMSGGAALTMGLDGSTTYDDPIGSCQWFVINKLYDLSVGANMAGAPSTQYFNCPPPTFSTPDYESTYLVGTAIAAQNLCALADEPNGFSLSGDFDVALPTGLSLGGTGNCTLSGTPTVEDEDGAALVFTVTNTAGDTGSLNVALYPLTTVALADCVDSPQSSCQAILDDMHAAVLIDGTTYAYNSTIVAGNVISQAPAAATQIAPFATVDIVVSLGTYEPTPTVSGYTFAIDPSAAATLYGVVLRWGAPEWNCEEIRNHNDGSGSLDLFGYSSVVSTAGEQVVLTLTGFSGAQLEYPRNNINIVGMNAANECSPVVVLPGLLKSAPGGRQYISVDVP